MRGLELSKSYFFEYGLPMLKQQFPKLLGNIAVALTGSGSECYGFDDDISQDHDFEPGFCIFVDESIDAKTFFQLEKAYRQLPKEFLGYKRKSNSPVGGQRHGVFRMKEYFVNKVGSDDGFLTIKQWFSIPDYVLAEAINGEVFLDESGMLSKIRNNLMQMPDDIFLKKLAGNLLMMEQAGHYNYKRCLKRLDNAAAQLCIYEFVQSCIKTVFLLNNSYAPYYKWTFKALRKLKKLSIIADLLEFLMVTTNDESNSNVKEDMIENIISLINDELLTQCIVDHYHSDLEKVAHHVNDKIQDAEIRNLDILIAIN